MTAPAQADWRGHHWRPHPRYYHGPVYGLSDGYFNPPLYGNCRWVRKVWWSHHEMHRRVVRVCY